MKTNEPLLVLRDYVDSSQRDFGAGVIPPLSSKHVAELESGRRNLGRNVAIRIVDGYRREMVAAGVTVEDLLRGEFRRRVRKRRAS